jgi:hypothetical protein
VIHAYPSVDDTSGPSLETVLHTSVDDASGPFLRGPAACRSFCNRDNCFMYSIYYLALPLMAVLDVGAGLLGRKTLVLNKEYQLTDLSADTVR